MKGFLMREKARITKVLVNGKEIKIDPPIELEEGDVISFPYEVAQQVVQPTVEGDEPLPADKNLRVRTKLL